LTLRALLPAIHARPTGGNVYNRRLFAPAGVRRTIFREGLTLAPGTWLIDSLIARQAAPLFASGVQPILIAHYLHLLDPARWHSREAARERALLPRFAGVVATSDYSRGILRAEGAANAVTIAPGLDSRDLLAAAARGADRARDAHKARTPRLLTVASLLPGKGLLGLIDVLESLADLDWRWELAGDATLDDGYAARVARRMARSPLHARLQLRPPLPPARLRALYDRSDLFVLPTRFETCSMVTREAMAHGLAVVAYDVGGLGANLPPRGAQCLAPAGDEAALAAQLRRLLVDARERQRVGAANRQAAMRFPTWEQSAAALQRWLASLSRGSARR
jgi:glycosyltransferase involved in cell wall biosynthesis